MSAVFAANLLPGLAHERRVAGLRCGFGRMNGRLGQYRYDRSSNRQWRRDAAAHAAGVATEDQWYEYDGLYQVGEFQRGTLSGSYPNFSGITPVVQNQDWNYDAMGNWLGFQSDALNQTRQFNKVNEITSINGPSGVVTPLYDPVGNMTTMPAVSDWNTAQTLKWDAWNRLVKVSEASNTIAEYSYDALFRRVTKTVSGTTRRFYYNDQWQILEEYTGPATNPETRYWYGLRDVNDIARRQFLGATNTDLYALRETMNIVAIVSASGAVQQRMAYDAFGNARFLSSMFGPGTNATNWNLLFHGHYRDADTGLYQMRFRYYHPNLGVWLGRDPLLEWGGLNLYLYTADSAINHIDYFGKQATPRIAYNTAIEAIKDCAKKAKMRALLPILAWEKERDQYLNANANSRLGFSKPRPTELEWGGRVCRSSKPPFEFYCAEETVGGSDHIYASKMKECDKGDCFEGIYHSHPTSTGLSERDGNVAFHGFITPIGKPRNETAEEERVRLGKIDKMKKCTARKPVGAAYIDLGGEIVVDVWDPNQPWDSSGHRNPPGSNFDGTNIKPRG